MHEGEILQKRNPKGPCIPTGLGLKRLTLPLTDDYDDVHFYILATFPKLKEVGGYELLRSSKGRVLEVVPPPPDGYSV